MQNGQRTCGRIGLIAGLCLMAGAAWAQTLVVDPDTGAMTTEGEDGQLSSKPFLPPPGVGGVDPLLQDSTLMQKVRLGPEPTTAIVSLTRSATSGAVAKQQAQALARREGLKRILQQQAPDQAAALLERITPEGLEALAVKTVALDEQTTATTYKAAVTVRYDARKLEALLGRPLQPLPEPPAPAPLVPGAGKASLVIPVWEEGGHAMIWKAENPWRRALNRAALQESKGKLVMPYGDPVDQLAVSDANIASLNFAELAHLTARYGTADVLVTRAKPVGGNAVNLTLTRLDARGKSEQTQLVAAPPETKREALLSKAASTVAQLARQQFQTAREGEVQASEAEHTVRALAPITRASDWAGMRAQLSALPMVVALTPVDIGPERVEMDLTFRGTPDAFGNALKNANIHVTPKGEKLMLGFYDVTD